MTPTQPPAELAKVPTRRKFDREEALEKALRLFWQYGYDTTSIAALTAELGINPPSLYAAFGKKSQLFDEVIALYQERHGFDLPTDRPAHDAVEWMLRQLARDYTDPSHPPGCIIISAAANYSPGDEDVVSRLRELRELTKRHIAAVVSADVARGHSIALADADRIATFYAAVIQGMHQQAADGASHADLNAIVDMAMSAWPFSTRAES